MTESTLDTEYIEQVLSWGIDHHVVDTWKIHRLGAKVDYVEIADSSGAVWKLNPEAAMAFVCALDLAIR